MVPRYTSVTIDMFKFYKKFEILDTRILNGVYINDIRAGNYFLLFVTRITANLDCERFRTPLSITSILRHRYLRFRRN